MRNNNLNLPAIINSGRRKLLTALLATSGFLVASNKASAVTADTSPAEKPSANPPSIDKPKEEEKSLRFPGDPPEHFVVYQLNKADADYQDHILFSVSAMLGQYNDNIKIVVTAFGPGIHILLKKPRRPVTQAIHDQVASLNDYGVEFHGCGNTLKALKLTQNDLLPFVKYVEVGASDIMELQKKGYAYISW